MIISGMIGIVFMYSARYISYEVFNTLWKTGSPDPQGIKVMELIKNMYDKILYPFIKIAVYFSLGILVIIMSTKRWNYCTKPLSGLIKYSQSKINSNSLSGYQLVTMNHLTCIADYHYYADLYYAD